MAAEGTETRASQGSRELSDLLAAELTGEVHLDETCSPATLDVAATDWVQALTILRDSAGLDYFDWLSAVDHGSAGFQVVAHLAAVGTPGSVQHVLVRTSLPAIEPSLPTATGVFRGAAWHERETYEMFGIGFEGHPHLVPLLLPDAFEGHPLRKDFVLAARAAKPWPGAKEPGESGDGAPTRRRLQPPGVPDETWGPRELSRPGGPPSRGDSDTWGPRSTQYDRRDAAAGGLSDRHEAGRRAGSDKSSARPGGPQ